MPNKLVTECIYTLCKCGSVQDVRLSLCCVTTLLYEGHLELLNSSGYWPFSPSHSCPTVWWWVLSVVSQSRMLWNNTQNIYMDLVSPTYELSWPTHSHSITKTRNVTCRHGGQLYMLSHCSVMWGILHQPAPNFMANFHHGLHLFGECKVKRRGAVLLD